MIGLRIGVAELAEIDSGAPCVVLAPGVAAPDWPPLVPLLLRDGKLLRPGAEPGGGLLPLPGRVRPLALVAPEAVAEHLRAMLPAGLKVVPDASRLPALLAGALKQLGAERDKAAAERDRLKRALPAPPFPRRILNLPPSPDAVATLPVRQPLGRAAEGICGIELHIAAPGGAGLQVRLRAGDRLLARWQVPAASVAPGWLALDLPEPAPPGPAEAVVEILAEGEAPRLSSTGIEPGAPVALRVCSAPAGWSLLPLHLDWAASFVPIPARPMALPRAVLEAAEVTGARATLAGLGEEAPRLLVPLPPGAEAAIALPPVPAGPADLLRARLTLAEGVPGTVTANLSVTTGEVVTTGQRAIDEALEIRLPLPPGPMPRLRLALINGGRESALVELSALALQVGAAGEPRRAPSPEPFMLPQAAPGPLPRVAIALPGHSAPRAPEAPRHGFVPPAAIAGATAFQEVRAHQHLVNTEGTYRHLEIGVSGLVSGGGLWRQVRLKLFDRRGTSGIEFREMKGWPAMFDSFPGGATDQYGPFWRLETAGTGAALRMLATPHDRALIAALLEVLADLAAQGAAAAGLAREEAEGWIARARALAAAVEAARGARGEA